MSKTFTATAVGLAVADNLLRLDDRLGAILPESLPDSVSPWLADVTVRDLLTMTSGLKVDWGMRGREDNWTEIMMAEPMAAEPGTTFAYDSMSSYLLSAIVQKVVGKNILEYLSERVFGPLEITGYAWDVSPEGVITGGWGLWMRPDDLAKFGQLLLDKGVWNGKHILPEDWVTEMMTKRVDVPGTSDYCYQMWTCPHEDAVRADGAWGQYIIIMPKEDMVAVVTQCQQGVSDRVQALVWNTLTPTLSDTPKKRDVMPVASLPESTAIRIPSRQGNHHPRLRFLGNTSLLLTIRWDGNLLKSRRRANSAPLCHRCIRQNR